MTSDELVDDIIKNNHHNEICEKLDKQYSITNYAVMLNDDPVCYTGSDVIDAANIVYILRKKYPDLELTISNEFMEII